MPQKKKILHIIQSLENGGCENMLLRTLPLLDGFEHKIIALKELGELTPAFVSADITVATIHCDGFFDIPGIFRLRKLVREENPNIILTYLFHADMIARLFLQNHTKVPTIPFLRTTYNHPKYLIARILEWLTKPLVKQYLANSEAVKNFYAEHLGIIPEKITVIPNGIDIDSFDSITPDPELKKSLGIKPDDFVIICVANLHINKGHKYLLEAFEQLSISTPPTHCHPGLPARLGRDPGSTPSPPSRLDESAKRVQGGELKRGLKLLLIGDGIKKENLQCQIQNYKSKENILFLGHRTDVPQLLKISDCFVLPTLFEGMSNALLEAMAAGLPIITTDIPENRILIQNGLDGLLVREKDSANLTKQMAYLRDNDAIRSALAEKARGKIERDFSLAQSAKKWENSLMRMLS